MRWLIVWSVIAITSASVRAEDVRARNGVVWELPWSDGWYVRFTDARPHRIQVADEWPVHPQRALLYVELQPTKDGTFAQVEAALATELARDGVTFAGEKVAAFAITAKAKKLAVKDASNHNHVARQVAAVMGHATINGRPARYVIAQVPSGPRKTSSVLVAVVRPGVSSEVETSSWEWFETAAKRTVYLKTPVEQAKEYKGKPLVHEPVLEQYITLADATASSTLTGGAPAWRTLAFDVADPHIQVPTTAWCEGKAGDGVGESVTVNLDFPAYAPDLWIAAGNWTSPEAFTSHNKVTRIAVTARDKTVKVDLPRERRWVKVPVGFGVPSVTLTIEQVEKGSVDHSCISGISFGQPVLHGVDKAARAALKQGVAALYADLEARDPKRLPRYYTGASRILVRQLSATELELTFPYDGDTLDTWRIEWKSGAWTIAAFGTRER